MTALDLMLSAWRGVTANKLRSALTLLGVMIGVAAVIVLLAVGNGSAQKIRDAIDALGTQNLTVRTVGMGSTGGALTTDVAEALASASLGHVAAVVPQASTSLSVSSAEASEDSATVLGTTEEYFEVSTAEIASGRSFTSAEETQSSKVAVIGADLATSLFPSGAATGQSVYVDGIPFTVVGVLADQSSSGTGDSNSTLIAPLTRVQKSFTGYSSLSSLIVQAVDSDSTGAATAELEIMLDQLLGLGEDDTATYVISDQTQLLETQAESADSFTGLLGAVAAISLLVGGIGVTNVMLVTVTERTREIGIRKALGATRRVILSQFLLEAALLSLTGGVLGVLIALGVTQFEINGTVPVIVGYSIPLALGVSAAIGIFFGAYPAGRAAALRPIQALRFT